MQVAESNIFDTETEKVRDTLGFSATIPIVFFLGDHDELSPSLYHKVYANRNA